MKKLFLLLAVALVALSASAQLYQKPEKVGKFEIEPFYGLGFGYKYHGQCSDLAATTGVELRGNISNSPWAIGGFMRFDAVSYNFKDYYVPENTIMFDKRQDNYILSLGAVTEFNFRQGRKVNPFAGFSLGFSIYATEDNGGYSHPHDTEGTSAIFIPRIGVELWGWVRFTAYTVLLRKGYNATGITVGVTFGGKRKN